MKHIPGFKAFIEKYCENEDVIYGLGDQVRLIIINLIRIRSLITSQINKHANQPGNEDRRDLIEPALYAAADYTQTSDKLSKDSLKGPKSEFRGYNNDLTAQLIMPIRHLHSYKKNPTKSVHFTLPKYKPPLAYAFPPVVVQNTKLTTFGQRALSPF